MDKTLDTIVSSISYGALVLLASSFPMLFVEYGRFLDPLQMLIDLIIAVSLFFLGRYIRKKNNLQPRHAVYIILGIFVGIFAWYGISFVSYYIEMRRYV
ncbi:MAG: hypothetical protein WCP91_02195 [Candidatus Berkelbacteria bacterium]